MTRRDDLIAAAANNYKEQLQQLLESSDPHMTHEAENDARLEALRAAILSNHSEIVRMLLSNVRTTPEQMLELKELNHNPIFGNGSQGHKEIFDILNPELAEQEAADILEIERHQSEYRLHHIIDIPKETLENLAVTYVSSDRVNIPDSLTALKYMLNAIHYMTLNLLEAKKHDFSLQADDNQKWIHDYRAYEMLQAISACTFYLREFDPEKLSKLSLSAVDWKALALFVRENQYDPSFVGNFSYSEKVKLINEALHSILDSGEFEMIARNLESLTQLIDGIQQRKTEKQSLLEEIKALKSSLKDLAADKALILNEIKDKTATTEKLQAEIIDITGKMHQTIIAHHPRLLTTLVDFIKDERSAEHIQNAIEDKSVDSESILYSFIKLGEALENASYALKSLFDNNAVQHVIKVRNLLCHPEIPENNQQIRAFLDEGVSTLTIARENIDLKQLLEYWRAEPQQKLILTYAINLSTKMYAPDLSPVARWDGIKEMYAGSLMSEAAVEKNSEAVLDDKLSYLESKQFKTIHDVTEIYKLKLERMMESVKSEKGRINEEIAAIKKASELASKYLRANTKNYQKAKEQEEVATEDQRALICEYEEKRSEKFRNDQLLEQKRSKLNDIDSGMQSSIDSFNKLRKDEIKEITCYMLREYVRYAQEVEKFFNDINAKHLLLAKQQFEECTVLDDEGNWQIDQVKAKAIGSLDSEHSKLQFYQIMVGSIARGVLDIKDHVEEVAPMFSDELCLMFKDIIIPSRGYLGHIAMRQAGKASSESVDSAEVFYENSKKIVESIKLVSIILNRLMEEATTQDSFEQEAVVIHARDESWEAEEDEVEVAMPSSGQRTVINDLLDKQEVNNTEITSAEKALVESVITASTMDDPQLGGLGMVADARLGLSMVQLVQEQAQRERPFN